jgi:hypothetical protein
VVREFTDEEGRRWTATVRTDQGPDYKGRYYLVLRPREESQGDGLELGDVRWNSERTARRTLETMSEVELRRRLRIALGRAGLRRAS